jgi:hypothetical protein
MWRLKRFFGFGASKGPKTEVAASGTSSIDGLPASQAAIAEIYDINVAARRPPPQAREAVAVLEQLKQSQRRWY